MGVTATPLLSGARNYDRIIEGILRGQAGMDVREITSWQSGVSNTLVGTGAVTARLLKWEATSGATGSSTVSSFIDPLDGTGSGFSAGQGYQVIDWRKRVILLVKATGLTSGANGVSRLFWGKNNGDGLGESARPGIGFKLEGLVVKGFSHNGSVLATTAALLTLTSAVDAYLMAISDGAGTTSFYHSTGGGTWTAGPTAAGPAAASGSGNNAIFLETLNGADAAAQRLIIHKMVLGVGQ